MREWRDAAPGGVVWLGPMKMKNTHPHTYEVPMHAFCFSYYILRPSQFLFSIVSTRPHTCGESACSFTHVGARCNGSSHPRRLVSLHACLDLSPLPLTPLLQAMFRMWTHNNVMEYKRNHRTVFFGHVFFHNFRLRPHERARGGLRLPAVAPSECVCMLPRHQPAVEPNVRR